MSDAAPAPGSGDPQPTVEQAALSVGTPAMPPPSPNGTAPPAPVAGSDRPELAVGVAFAGGFALAILLRRLGR